METRNLLTEEQKEFLVDYINEKINIKIIGEKIEEIIFTIAVNKSISVLQEHLPDEIQDFIYDISKGIEQGGPAINVMKTNAVEFMAEHFKFIFLSKNQVRSISTALIDFLFAAITKGKNIDSEIAELKTAEKS